MSNLNLAYTRAVLKSVTIDVLRHNPAANLKAAWVWEAGRDHWEFHYNDFYWHGRSHNASEAYSAGWTAWLTKQGAEGYNDGDGA
jgi:hypothetical protein